MAYGFACVVLQNLNQFFLVLFVMLGSFNGMYDLNKIYMIFYVLSLIIWEFQREVLWTPYVLVPWNLGKYITFDNKHIPIFDNKSMLWCKRRCNDWGINRWMLISRMEHKCVERMWRDTCEHISTRSQLEIIKKKPDSDLKRPDQK